MAEAETAESAPAEAEPQQLEQWQINEKRRCEIEHKRMLKNIAEAVSALTLPGRPPRTHTAPRAAC